MRFAADSLTVSQIEGNTGTTAFVFTVERTGGTTGAVDFSGQVSSAAANSQDFAGAPALPFAFSGTIPADQASVTVTVNVAGDVAVEAAESFTLALQAATNTLSVPTTIDAAQDEATGTIQNDDAAAGITILAEAQSLQGQAGTPTATNAIELVRLGAFAATGGNAEVVSFDPTSDQLYILNTTGNKIEIVKIGATGSLTKTGEIDLSTLTEFGGANSVAIKNGVVAVAYGNATAGEAGHVALFNAAGVLQTTVEVGVLPDMLTFTPDGSRILVANEAEPVSAANNAAGTISIINLAGGAASATVSNTISFASLNGSEGALEQAGLALFPGQSAANDIEPEYIAVSPNGTRAYVTLQEVNAVAVIDLTNPAADQPLSILPLGMIDRSLVGNEFDGSDQDGAGTAGSIQIENHPVFSLLQPDAIASFSSGGVTYFVTANEGDARVVFGLRRGAAEQRLLQPRRHRFPQRGRPEEQRRHRPAECHQSRGRHRRRRRHRPDRHLWRPRHLDLPPERRRQHHQGARDRRRVREDPRQPAERGNELQQREHGRQLRHPLRQQGSGARRRDRAGDQRQALCVRDARARRRRHDLRRHRSGQCVLRQL